MNIEVDDEVDMNIFDDDSEEDELDEISSTISASTVNSLKSASNELTAAVIEEPASSAITVKNPVKVKKEISAAVSEVCHDEVVNNLKVLQKKKIVGEEPKGQSGLGMFHDIPAVVEMEEIVPKPKHKTLTFQEDPMQFHAKPRDLAKNALKRARDVDPDAPITNHIFSRVSFAALPLDVRLSGLLEKSVAEGGMGLLSSTRIQSVVVPLLTKPQNILMKSQTGSGKTLAYLIPLLNDLMGLVPALKRGDGTRALVIAPTRELCSQIADVLAKLTQCCVWIVGGSITGGEKKKSEKARLRKGVTVLVGTAGRLLDHLKSTESFTLNKLRWVVLDEVDRLLDLGFEQTILEILSTIRGERLPGLKDREAKSQGGSMRQRYNQQEALLAKQVDSGDGLFHMMASATLTRSVRQLAMPVMGGAGFVVVDSDREAVDYIVNASDLMDLGKDTGRLDGEVAGTKAVGNGSGVRDGDEDGDDEEVEEGRGGKSAMGSKKLRTNLEKGEVMEAPKQLAQYYMMVTCKWRLAALLCFLKTHAHQKVMVFFSTCDSVDFHALLFRETEWPLDLDAAIEGQTDSEGGGGSRFGHASSGSNGNGKGYKRDRQEDTPQSSSNRSDFIEPLPSSFSGMFGDDCLMYRLHGNVPQNVRQTVYKDFCKAKSGIMLCTDVAARGLDLPEVDWILQYDPPCDTTDYVHRVGRTARRGRQGSALLFLLPSEASYVTLLGSHSLVPEALSLQSLFVDGSKSIPGAKKFKNIDEMTAVVLQRRLETTIVKCRPLGGAARQAFGSFVRAYATHSMDTKGIFRVQSLHLGHLAKCFGLRESPKTLRVHDDNISKIFNGLYSAALFNDKEAKKKARDEKFSLSRGVKKAAQAAKPPQTGGNKWRGGATDNNAQKSVTSSSDGDGDSEVVSSSSTVKAVAQTKPDVSTTSKPIPIIIPSDKRKMRIGAGSGRAGSGGSGKLLAPSGKFRKSAEGYFKKKLRTQSSSEFSA